MAEYINKKDILQRIESAVMWNRSVSALYEDIEDMEPADVAPVVHGRWVHKILLGEQAWFCSECKTIGSPQWKRCPVCEAKMDGGGDHA